MDLLSQLNALALPEYQKGLIKQRIENVMLYQRLRPRVKKATFNPGGDLYMGVETSFPIPGGARREGQDVMLPGQHTFAQMHDNVYEVMNVAGISKEVMRRLINQTQAFIDMPKNALDNCGVGFDIIMNLILHGDSTGRIGQVASATGDGTGCVVTLDNTRADFGWAGASMIRKGMRVDIKTWADGTEKVVGMTVTAVTATTITLGATATYGGTYTAAPADNDIVFWNGSATWTGSAWQFNLPNGLLNLVDDGATTAGPGTGHNGSWAGATIHGLDRTTANGAHLKATVLKADDWYGTGGVAGTPHSWTLDHLEEQLDNLESYGTSGAKVTAMLGTPKTLRCFTRKAKLDMNYTLTSVGTSDIIPGRKVKQYHWNDRDIPLLSIPTLPENTLYILDENQITWREHVPIGFCDDFGTTPWFPAPGERNRTFEAWMETQFQLTIEHGDALMRMEDLDTDE